MGSWLRFSRGVLAGILALAAAAGLTLAVVQSWMAHAVFDDDRFAGIAVRVVEREEIRIELRRVIVDQAIQQQPDLVAARPLLETVVDTTLASRAVEPIIAEAARELHRAFFEAERRSIVLNVSDVMTLAVAGIRAYDADLAERVPGGPNVGNVTISQRNAATRALEVDRQLQAFRWFLLIGAAGLLTAAMILSPHRYQVVTMLGAGLATGAVFVWLAVGIIADVIGDSVSGSPVARAAAVAVWEIYTDGLVWWMWIQAIIGVVLATVGASTSSAVPTHERVRRLAGFVDQAWDRRTPRLVLAGTVASLGLLLLVAPGPTVRLLAQAIGLALLFFGGSEVLRGLGLARGRSRVPKAPEPGSRLPFGMPRVALPQALAGVGLVFGLGTALMVFWLNRDALNAAPASSRPPIEQCNGSADLCDRRLDEIVFAATHNSMSAADEPGWYFASHMSSIPQQLEDGVRVLLIDLYYGYATNRGVRTDPALVDIPARIEEGLGEATAEAAHNLMNAIGPIPSGAVPSLYLCHAYCELGATSFDQTLIQLRQFLDDNPHEVVVLFLQDYVSPFDVEDAFHRAGAFRYAYTLDDEAGLPTLREMIEADRRLLVFSENIGDDDAPPWYHDGFVWVQDTPYEFRSAVELSCVPNRGRQDRPIFLMNHWIARLAPSPEDAELLNDFDFLMERARQCEEERGLLPNFIAVNFYEVGELFRVVDELNTREEQETDD